MDFVERLVAWKDATLTRMKDRSWRLWFFVVAAGYLIFEGVRALISDAGTWILWWGFVGARWFLSQPMGVGGLLIFVYLALLVGLAWWQTRPRAPEKDVEESPELSAEERQMIQDIRAAWNRYGELAVTQMRDILRNSKHELEDRVYWADLLEPIVAEVDRGIDGLRKKLKEGSGAGIREVRNQFNHLYACYGKAMKWVARMQARENLEQCDPNSQRYKVWRQNHKDFVDRLRDMNQDPRHHGTLKYRVEPLDEDFGRMVRDAEMSEEWKDLIRQETQ